MFAQAEEHAAPVVNVTVESATPDVIVQPASPDVIVNVSGSGELGPIPPTCNNDPVRTWQRPPDGKYLYFGNNVYSIAKFDGYRISFNSFNQTYTVEGTLVNGAPTVDGGFLSRDDAENCLYELIDAGRL